MASTLRMWAVFSILVVNADAVPVLFQANCGIYQRLTSRHCMVELHQEKLMRVTYSIALLCGSTISRTLPLDLGPLHPIGSATHDSEYLEAALGQWQSLRTKSLMNSALCHAKFPPLLN